MLFFVYGGIATATLKQKILLNKNMNFGNDCIDDVFFQSILTFGFNNTDWKMDHMSWKQSYASHYWNLIL